MQSLRIDMHVMNKHGELLLRNKASHVPRVGDELVIKSSLTPQVYKVLGIRWCYEDDMVIIYVKNI
jgi:hypothetical protein